MEPLTHFMFGGVLARAGLNRKSTLATLTLVLAAEAPDLDVLTEFKGRITSFGHHRGITHTFVGVPLMAAVVVLVIYLVYHLYHAGGRRKSEKPPPKWSVLFLLACLAGLSHILLDFTNNYGVRPFEPFSYRWYSWDIVYIVEPVLWLILAGGLLLPSLFGWVSDEIRSSRRREGPRGRTAAIVALLLVAAFWGFRDFQHRRAISAMQALTYEGETPLRMSAFPYPLNPFRWYGVVETPRFYDSMIVNSWIPEVNPDDQAMVRFKPEQTAAVLAAKQSHLGRVFMDWAQYPMTETEYLPQPEEGYLVRFFDVRFAYPGSAHRLSGWVQLAPDLQVVNERFGMRGIPGSQQVQKRSLQ